MLRRGVDSGSTSGIEHQSSREDDSEELDEREKLRRKKISAANKGNTPWNKGRKHSAETLQRIRERTRLAMQNPKVRMKLVKLGHAQSEETRIKIGAGVRMGWERRREKLMLQETCCFDWQNLIAEASRRGFVGEEELQWDSYKILDEQLEQEWLESVEQRKKLPRAKGSKRAPKSLEQRRKISEAISAKWADPVFREKVCSLPFPDITVYQSELKGSRGEGQVDPLASSKLEMIKNIRAQRAATETKKTEAIEQAKLLIAEAEKAANALEVAAMTNPLAQASLTETRKLIAEAIQSIQSIEIGQINSHEDAQHPATTPVELVNHAEKKTYPGIHCLEQTDHGKVNGTQAMVSSKSDIKDFGFGEFNFQDLFNGKDEGLPTSSTGYGLLNGKNEVYRTGNNDHRLHPFVEPSRFTEQLSQFESNGKIGQENELLPGGDDDVQLEKKEIPPNSTPVTKKWVRGRLVEVEVEEEE
ncbi:hypothetical protein Acr_16g0009860 [Actinidia rufa]|uniref:Nuclease associated modular domain-containing protein n=1 Tax=Actinidia rufa TaxID=165716 RepID=A0A7J0G091_9ERIC|nr:hypothetical protein Acr_16g0009860 [Actinidia rufa]